MKILDKIANFFGDGLGFMRCINCDKTIWNHEDGGYLLYPSEGIFHDKDRYPISVLAYCNRCPRPTRNGKLYKIELHSPYFLKPLNDEAYYFECMRAGKDGALFKATKEVPLPET